MNPSRSQQPRIFRTQARPGGLRTDLFVCCFALIFALFCPITFSAQPLLPKREVPKRPQTAAKITRSGYTEPQITKGSLIQQVAYDEGEEEYEQIANGFPDLDYSESDEDTQDERTYLPDPITNFTFPELDLENNAQTEHKIENPGNQNWGILVSPKPANANSTALPEMYAPYSQQYQQNPVASNYGNYNQFQSNYAGYAAAAQYPYLQAAYAANANYVYPQVNPYYAWPQQQSTSNPYMYPNPYYYYPNAQSGYWVYQQPDYARQNREQYKVEDEGPGFTDTFLETLSNFNPLKSPRGPNRGVGGPLMMRSWLDRPFYIGVFAGAMDGDQLVNRLLNQDCGATGGFSLGWNCDNYWGLESRLFFTSLPVEDTAYAIRKYEEQFPPDTYLRPLTTRNNSMTTFDVSVHYYPLGNAKWRPFLKLGIGLASQTFRDIEGTKYSVNSCVVPVGIGLKYWWNERIALQLDVVDNVFFAADGTKTQNNWTATVGLNFPLGKIKRKDPIVYWPAVPSSSR